MSKTVAALIVAAGRGTRAAGAAGVPKQYAPLAGATVLAHTLTAFASHPGIARVQVVIHPDDMNLYAAAIEGCDQAKLAPRVPGGATRQDSVRLGLEALAGAGVSSVLIHDAARPFISADIIDRVIAALEGHSCVLAAEPVADTLKRAGEGGTVAETVDRNGLWRAQTPQAFDFATILDLHGRAASAGRHDFTDDAALAEWAGLPVKLVAGSSRNTKITTAEDLAMADKLLGQTAMEPRTGTGLRRASLRGRQRRLAVRGRDPPYPQARRAFRCRRRVACAHRRAAGRHRRRRHRPAFSAE